MIDRIPVLKLGNVLLVSIQVDLEDTLALALQEDLSERIADTGARGVLIDISALEIVDSFIGRTLSTIAATSKVLDAETVVVGMRPAVAITLVELGLSLPGVQTALNVDKGLALLASRLRRVDGGSDGALYRDADGDLDGSQGLEGDGARRSAGGLPDLTALGPGGALSL